MEKIKLKIIKKKLSKKEFKKITIILKSENKISILASLSEKNIHKYFDKLIKSDHLELFTVSQKSIIGYAVLAKKPDYLIKEFNEFKIPFLFDLFFRFKILTLLNVFLSTLGLDSFFISNTKKKIMSNSINLNLLAIEKKHQSKGLGEKFLKYIFKKTNNRSKYVTCETNSERSIHFYKSKMKFIIAGKKIRFPKLMNILIKKL